jgi:hypothetical protein
MSTATIGRKILLSTPLLASAALALPLVSQAATAPPKSGPPLVTTGAVAKVRGTSAELRGVIDPRGAATTYYFEYGPTVAYGGRTSTASLPAGFRRVKVARPVVGLQPGYHYRLAATNAFIPSGAKFGRDRIYTPKSSRLALAFVIPKPSATVFGSPVTVSGTLSGVGGANRTIVLQESPYPFLEGFASVGSPQVTSAAGSFSFRVGVLSQSAQFRVNTLDPRPLYSKIVTEAVAVRVTFKVRLAGRRGYVRLYGTVTPSHVGARVMFQVQKHVRPGKSKRTAERTDSWVTQASTVVKRATKTLSRFSAIVSIRHSGRYRVFVLVPRGAFVSGFSQSIVLHAAPARKTHRNKH